MIFDSFLVTDEKYAGRKYEDFLVNKSGGDIIVNYEKHYGKLLPDIDGEYLIYVFQELSRSLKARKISDRATTDFSERLYKIFSEDQWDALQSGWLAVKQSVQNLRSGKGNEVIPQAGLDFDSLSDEQSKVVMDYLNSIYFSNIASMIDKNLEICQKISGSSSLKLKGKLSLLAIDSSDKKETLIHNYNLPKKVGFRFIGKPRSEKYFDTSINDISKEKILRIDKYPVYLHNQRVAIDDVSMRRLYGSETCMRISERLKVKKDSNKDKLTVPSLVRLSIPLCLKNFMKSIATSNNYMEEQLKFISTFHNMKSDSAWMLFQKIKKESNYLTGINSSDNESLRNLLVLSTIMEAKLAQMMWYCLLPEITNFPDPYRLDDLKNIVLCGEKVKGPNGSTIFQFTAAVKGERDYLSGGPGFSVMMK